MDAVVMNVHFLLVILLKFLSYRDSEEETGQREGYDMQKRSLAAIEPYCGYVVDTVTFQLPRCSKCFISLYTGKKY